MDAKQGCHQVKVREWDIGKLAFFVPDHKNWAFTVMPFGPVNAPAFYSCIMGNFKVKWDSLFLESMSLMASSNTKLDGKNQCYR